MIVPVQNRVINPAAEWGLSSALVTNDVAITLDLDGTYTVEFWFYSGTAAAETIIDFTADAGVGKITRTATDYATTSGTIYVNNALGSTFTVNTWQHVSVRGMTIDSNNSMNIKGFVGQIASLAIFSGSSGYPNRYQRPTGREVNCVGYWPFLPVSNPAILRDVSNNANNGTISGPIWVRGNAVSQTVTSTDFHIATANGEAMCFHDTIPLNAYAGALGNTPYMLEMADSAGKTARGWIANAGGGLALGSNLLTSFTETLALASCTIDGTDIVSATSGSTSGTVASHAIPSLIGELYQFTSESVTITNNTSVFRCEPSNTLHQGSKYTYTLNPVKLIHYPAIEFTTPHYLGFRVTPTGATLTALGNTFKKVTDVPTTGLHLVTALDGSTRGAVAETGFNPNAVSNLRIFRVK
jgi:hypothetical protein